MLEKTLQAWVVSRAEAAGFRVWHVPTPMKPIGRNTFVPDSRGRGLPDLLMLHTEQPRLIFAELKSDDGVTSDEQDEFLALARRLSEATRGEDGHRVVETYLWRPQGQELIERILAS